MASAASAISGEVMTRTTAETAMSTRRRIIWGCPDGRGSSGSLRRIPGGGGAAPRPFPQARGRRQRGEHVVARDQQRTGGQRSRQQRRRQQRELKRERDHIQ